MKKDVLIRLRQELDAVIGSEAVDVPMTLAQSLIEALRELRIECPDSSTLHDDLGRALQGIEDAWLKGSEPPAHLPGGPRRQAELSKLLSDVAAVQRFALSLARGDLSHSLKAKGLMAGSLKGLQANLRHLTWQTRMIAKGDFSQKVDFMGEFSDAFNSMVSSLAEARDQLRHREEELVQLTEELKRSNTDLQQFAYAASHDLQEPLRVIAGFVSLLEKRYRGKLDEKADEFIAYTVDGVQRMQMLIKGLLAYSQVDTKRRTFEPTDCSFVLRQALSNLQTAIEESGAHITDVPLPTVMADAVQVTRLFQNLIGNAIKFRGKEAPEISISAERKENEWVFSVRDNGIGIDRKFAETIFVIFQRLHTRQEYDGTGIGLAVCKKIAERHGGRIWVESEPGKGSAFYFTVPA